MAPSTSLNMEHPHRRPTCIKSCPAVAQRAPHAQVLPENQQEEEEEQAGDRIGSMIDDALAMLEGQQGVGVFCVCEPMCACKEQCAIAARHTECACTCFEAFWEDHVRKEPADAAAPAAQAHAAEEDRAVTPRSISVYSQGSIQASLQGHQAHAPGGNDHTSLSAEGTWSASRAGMWARLPAPGPPTPSRPTKPNASKG